jgi:electron transfer flavoprotein alpha subunit
MSQDIFVLVEHFRGKVADISYMMLAQARQLAPATGGKVIAILLGSYSKVLANDLNVDAVWYVDHPALADFTWDAYEKVLAKLVGEYKPRLVLFGDTTIGAEAASGLSARLNLPILSFCRKITPDGSNLKYTGQICGGKMMVEGALPVETTLVTLLPGGFKVEQGKSDKAPDVTPIDCPDLGDLRVTLKGYIEPAGGDIDISAEKVLIGVGRGIENADNLELAEELAKALGGAVCATRPVVDQNWLPTTRLVGKSGNTVKPKLYIAMGISGAPEHVEAITGSELIIAVNRDPKAPIFNIAKYGVETDLFDLVEVLTEKVKDAKGG